MAAKTSKQVEVSIVNDIVNNNCCYSDIIKKYNISYKTIVRISKQYNVYNIISSNSKNILIKKFTKTNKNKAYERYKNVNEEYGIIIEKMINNNYTMTDILKKTGLLQTFFTRFIKWKSLELYNKLKENGRICISNNATNLCLVNAKKNIGKIKLIPQDVVELFLDLKNEGYCLSQIKRKLRPLGFGHDKIKELIQLYGHPKLYSNVGKNNPMYGKSPSINAGVGIKGYIIGGNIKIFFRSFLECLIFYYLIKNNINFCMSYHRINYFNNNGVQKTYCPDIVIDNTIYEIKPSAMINTGENTEKFIAAKKYCEHYGLLFDIITEKTYSLSAAFNNALKSINSKNENDIIINMNEQNVQKLNRNIVNGEIKWLL